MDNQNNHSEIKDSPTIMETGIRFGSILALLSIILFLIPAVAGFNPFKGGWNWFGAGVSLLTMFWAQKKFKDDGDGFMSYGQGVSIIFWIAAISTVVSILFSYSYTTFIDDGPFEMFMIQQEDEMIANGAPDDMIETSLTWTRKLFWIIGLVAGFIFTMIMGFVLTIFTKNQSKEAPF